MGTIGKFGFSAIALTSLRLVGGHHAVTKSKSPLNLWGIAMPEFTENPSDALGISESLTMQVSNYKPMFGSVEGADRYFSEQIYGQLWEVQSLTKKQQALMTATRNLNSLRFAGRKTDEGQPLEFPRNGGT